MWSVWASIAALAIFLEKTMAYVEFVEEYGFENTSIRLTCRHFDSIIAIRESKFEPFDVNNIHFEENRASTELRRSINQRCSGVNHCSYILNEDCPGAELWGPGNFSVKYACISDKERIKYCNKEIILPNTTSSSEFKSEAYIHSPGYPKFYLGNQACAWTIRAPEYQKIKITILDLSLIGNSYACQDQLEILDSGQSIYSSCLQEVPALEIVSVTDTLEIRLTSIETVIPRRGVLFHFTAVGCHPPMLPKNAYQVFRNDSIAVLSCCADYAFSDSYQKTKGLQCVGYRWNATFPIAGCDSERSISGANNYFVVKAKEESSMKELIAPICVIALLFGINAVILFIIFQYRRRKSENPPCVEEELKTFSVSTSGDQMA